MKKTLIILLIISSFILNAQHSDLQQNNWYVQSVTINSVTTIIPNDPIDFPYAYLNFFNSTSGLIGSENAVSFNLTNCNIGFGGHVNYNGFDIFIFSDFTPFQIITDCSIPIIDFMNLYISFYNNEITEQFTYSITTETDNSKTLLITNNNGDTIVYTNTFFNLPPQELTDNNWYLQELIIEDNSIIPPNNEELSLIPLNFTYSENGLSTSACSNLIGFYFFDYSLSTFHLYEIGTNFGLTLCNPSIPENNTFTDLYIRNFYLDSLPGPFSYEHTINGNNKTLTITNALGNQAVYSNFTLSTQEFTNSLFSIYPNPVKEFLNITVSNNERILQVSIYNLLSKKILTTKENSINLSKYENGIYFVKILTENGNRITKKIIKIGA